MKMSIGNIHPITKFTRESVKYFESIGFSVYEGPEVDSEWYNFDALNMPNDHPARDIQDTFFLKDKRLLRTHTSNSQIRYGKENKPPFRVIVPGQVYRNEATDYSHETNIMQLEGLYIDKDVCVGHLFYTLKEFFKHIFGQSCDARFRPSFFPFVEPGFEVDAKYKDKWIELLGAGMVHPKVIENMGINSSLYSGFAFGMGIDRLVMLKYDIEDIRLFRSGNLKFNKQFK